MLLFLTVFIPLNIYTSISKKLSKVVTLLIFPYCSCLMFQQHGKTGFQTSNCNIQLFDDIRTLPNCYEAYKISKLAGLIINNYRPEIPSDLGVGVLTVMICKRPQFNPQDFGGPGSFYFFLSKWHTF